MDCFYLTTNAITQYHYTLKNKVILHILYIKEESQFKNKEFQISNTSKRNGKMVNE